MVKGRVSPINSNRPLIDHLDVSKPETIAKIKEIFDDYTKGDDPTSTATRPCTSVPTSSSTTTRQP